MLRIGTAHFTDVEKTMVECHHDNIAVTAVAVLCPCLRLPFSIALPWYRHVSAVQLSLSSDSAAPKPATTTANCVATQKEPGRKPW